MQELMLGLDVGTTAVKAAAYTATGRAVAFAEHPSEVLRRGPGGAEQDMETVWRTAARCLGDLVARVGPARFVSLGVCGQGDGLWPVDAAGRPVRPAMLWNDTRATRDVEELTRSGATRAVGRGCHTALWTGMAAVLWRWLREAEPEAAARTAHALTCADWIAFRLTGRIGTDLSNASIPFLDFDRRSYGEAIEALDCADLRPRLSPIARADARLGGLSADAARATGLPEGLPVSVGTLDLAAMLVGMAMDRPGQTMMIMGTTAVVNILTDRIRPRDEPLAASVLHPTAPLAIRVLAPSTGAAALDWFAGLQAAGEGAGSAAALAESARAVPVGAHGVTFLPYLNGERAPFVAADLRGMFHGLSSTTTQADLARAVMEGAALSLRHCCMAEGGLPTAPVHLTGGGSRSAVWCQIIADCIGQPVVTTAQSDQGLWGAACLGASAAGRGAAVALAARAQDIRQFDPRPETAPLYSHLFARYLILSRGLRALQAELRAATETLP